MIMQSHVIVLYELQPSPLPEVQLLLREDVLQTLMIRLNITMVFDEKVDGERGNFKKFPTIMQDLFM